MDRSLKDSNLLGLVYGGLRFGEMLKNTGSKAQRDQFISFIGQNNSVARDKLVDPFWIFIDISFLCREYKSQRSFGSLSAFGLSVFKVLVF